MHFSTTAKASITALTLGTLFALSGQAAQAVTFSGSSSGQWGMPANPSGSTVLSNQNGGTNNRLSWGRTDLCLGCTPFNNYVQYDGLSFNAEVGSLFNLGNLSYRNGSTWDSFDGSFPLSIALSFTNPISSNQAFNYSFNIFNTPNNTGNAVLDGDKLQFSGGMLSQNSFNFNGRNYALEIMGFSSDGGQTLVNEFNSPEGTLANASLYGKLRDVTPELESVPEPGTVAALSVVAVGLLARRRHNSKSPFSKFKA